MPIVADNTDDSTNYTEQIRSFRVAKTMHAFLTRRARAMDVKIPDVIRYIIGEHMERNGAGSDASTERGNAED